MSNTRHLAGEWVKTYRQNVIAKNFFGASAVLQEHMLSARPLNKDRYTEKLAKVVRGLAHQILIHDRGACSHTRQDEDQQVRAEEVEKLLKSFIGATHPYIFEKSKQIHDRVCGVIAMVPPSMGERLNGVLEDRISSAPTFSLTRS